jgi:hypothetical protein
MEPRSRWRTTNLVLHRNFGYFFSLLTIVYCLSGLALNHINEWNPDFILTKREIQVEPRLAAGARLSPEELAALDRLVGEARQRASDYPTPDEVKVYYESGSLYLDLVMGSGVYENLRRRPIFYESNVLHRNSAPGWRWASDVFAIALIIINVTSLLVLRGRYGLGGRGKWLVLAGATAPRWRWACTRSAAESPSDAVQLLAHPLGLMALAYSTSSGSSSSPKPNISRMLRTSA